jgi:hypothetical protein
VPNLLAALSFRVGRKRREVLDRVNGRDFNCNPCRVEAQLYTAAVAWITQADSPEKASRSREIKQIALVPGTGTRAGRVK